METLFFVPYFYFISPPKYEQEKEIDLETNVSKKKPPPSYHTLQLSTAPGGGAKFCFQFAPNCNQSLLPGGRKRSESTKKPVESVGWSLSGPPLSPLAREPVAQKAKLGRLPGSAPPAPLL